MRITLSLLLAVMTCLCLTLQVQAAPSPEAFGELPAIYDAAISPDGDELASIVNFKGKYLISVTSINPKPGEKPRVLGLEKGVKPSYIKWANDKQVLAVFWQSQKYGTLPITSSYIYTFDTVALKGKILVKPARGYLRQNNSNVVDWLEDDPNHILMAYDKDTNNDKPSIFKVNVETGAAKNIQRGMGNISSWRTDANGTPRIGQGRKDDANATPVMRVWDIIKEKWIDSSGYPGLDADAPVYGFTKNPNELVIGDYRGKDTLGLYVYDLGAKSITRKIYHNEKYDAEGVVRSKDGDEIIGARYTADTSEVELLGNYDTLLARMRSKFPHYTVDFVDQSSSGDTVLFKISGPYEPGNLMMIKAGQSEPTSLGELRPNLPSQEMGEVISVKYSARDGQKIPAYVTLPPKVTDTSMIKSLPFIILPHGGPYSRDSKRFDYFAQFFASRGYGVLQMNFRGSEGYGKAYEEAGRQNWIVMQEDVEDGMRWLLRKGYADPKRSCIARWSYGGYASLMGAAKTGELYSCAIAMAAVTDLKDLIRDMKKYKYGRSTAKKFVNDGFENKEEIKANSPARVAENIKIPVFLAHGTLDQRVHFDQYTRMKRALKKSGSKATFMEFVDEDHFLSNQENRQRFFNGLDKFLTEVNGKSEFMQ